MLSSSASAPNAGMTSTNGPAVRKLSFLRCARHWGTKSSCSSTRTAGSPPQRAIEVGRRLEDNGVAHFEEPCLYWELEQTKEVARALAIDVTGGEQDCMIPTWRQMIDIRAVDIIQPDVCYLGASRERCRLRRLGRAAGLPCTPHSANLSMVTLFTMHLLGAIPNAGKYLEFSIEGPDYYPWQEGLFRAFALRRA